MLRISLRLEDLNIYFYDVFFYLFYGFKKGVYGKQGKFLLWDSYEVR